jgi:cation:H+ antiporter
VIGANVAICLVALGVGAVIAPLPFPARVMRYAGLAVPLGVVAAWFAWSGVVTRLHGVVLLGLYVVYVGAIWLIERRPPELGEVHELEEAKERAGKAGPRGRIGRDLFLVIAGVGAMVAGAVLLVEAVRRLANVESTQTLLGLTLVGFATAFELVALAWSAARRGASEAVVAGVVGSFAYNVTMTLGAGALANPLLILDAESLHRPWLAMLAAISLVMVLAARKGRLDRSDGVVLLTAYPAFILMVLLT